MFSDATDSESTLNSQENLIDEEIIGLILPKKIDRFKISAADVVKRNEQSALFSLFKSVDLILGNSNSFTFEQFEEDLKGRVNVIEINKNVVWDSQRDVWENLGNLDIEEEGPEWTSETKTIWKQAKNRFFDFSNTIFSNSPIILRIIYSLNRDILRSAVWEMLAQNYRFDGKQYHFTVDLPPSSNSTLKLSRQDTDESTTISLKFSAAVYEMVDLEASERLCLDEDGIKDPTEAFSPQKICEIELSIILLFENKVVIKPEVTIEIKVCSDCQKFRYSGGWALEVEQLENIDSEPELITNHFSTISNFETSLIQLLEKSNLQIGMAIERLISIKEMLDVGRGSGLSKFLSDVLKLYNAAVNLYLLKSDFILKYLEANNISLSISKIRELLSEALQKENKSIDSLIENVQPELIGILYKFSDIQLSQLSIIFNKDIISKIREACLFIYQNPEDFLTKSAQITSAAKLTQIIFIIMVSIQSIAFALKEVLHRKNIKILGFSEKDFSTTNDIAEILNAFRQFLGDIILNKILDNPLRDHTLVGLPFKLDNSLEFLLEEELFINKIEARDFNQANSEISKYRLLHLKLPEPKLTLSCCPSSAYPEKIAALWERNPILKGIMDGSAIYLTLRQLLTIYPDARARALPYLSLLNIAGGTIGMLTGVYGILNPKKPISTFIRLWEATTGSLVVCVFSMDSAIKIYLTIYPQNQKVSDLIFWTQIAPAPLTLTMAYAIWHSISFNSKEQWVSNSILRNRIKKACDIIGKFLFYGGTWVPFFKDVKLPENFVYGAIPAITGAFFTLGHFTRYKQRVEVSTKYLMAVSCTYMFINILLTEETSPWLYTQLGFWAFSLIPSVYFTLKNAVNFIEKYKEPPEIVIKAIPPNIWDPEPPSLVINNNDYNNLYNLSSNQGTTETTKLITFAKQLHDQRYQTIDLSLGEGSSSQLNLENKPKRNKAWSCCTLI